MPTSPNTDDIGSFLEMRLGRDPEPEAMNNDLRADIVRITLEKISNVCVEAFSTSILSTIYTYQRVYLDSSLFR